MTDVKRNQLTVVEATKAIEDDTYLKAALEEVLRWEEEDRELAQGRTNFQIEKFFLLENHTVPAAFHAALKNRRIMAEGFMQKIVEMKERYREFEYKWADKDKAKPIEWFTRDGGKKLCWFDLDEVEIHNYLKSSELEIRDRIQQMNFFDKILNKLIEKNGGPITRKQFENEDHIYWERRFAEQAFDEVVSAKTGISIGNIHSMRRGTAPTLVSDDQNRIKNGYGMLSDALNDPARFLSTLEEKIMQGIDEVATDAPLLRGQENTQQKLEGRQDPQEGFEMRKFIEE